MCIDFGYANISKSGTRTNQKVEREKANSWFAKNESPGSRKSNRRIPISIEKQRKMKTGRKQKMNRRRSKNETGRAPLIKSDAPQGLTAPRLRGWSAGFWVEGHRCALRSSVRSPDSKSFLFVRVCVLPCDSKLFRFLVRFCYSAVRPVKPGPEKKPENRAAPRPASRRYLCEQMAGLSLQNRCLSFFKSFVASMRAPGFFSVEFCFPVARMMFSPRLPKRFKKIRVLQGGAAPSARARLEKRLNLDECPRRTLRSKKIENMGFSEEFRKPKPLFLDSARSLLSCAQFSAPTDPCRGSYDHRVPTPFRFFVPLFCKKCPFFQNCRFHIDEPPTPPWANAWFLADALVARHLH